MWTYALTFIVIVSSGILLIALVWFLTGGTKIKKTYCSECGGNSYRVNHTFVCGDCGNHFEVPESD